MGFPCGSAGKEYICLQRWIPGFDPWVGKIPWRWERLPTPVFWPGEFYGVYSPWSQRVGHDWATSTTLYCTLPPWTNQTWHYFWIKKALLGPKPIWSGPGMDQVVKGDPAASLFVEKGSRPLFGIPVTKHQLSSRPDSSISLRSSRRTLMWNSTVSLISQQKKQGPASINSLLEQTVRHQCFGLTTHSQSHSWLPILPRKCAWSVV